LDEPTIGLDSKQVTVLYSVLKKIVYNGNTVIVVEHDPEFIQTADYIVEMGPGAGKLGGEVIYQGELSGLDKQSVTYQLLNEKSKVFKKHKTKGDVFGVKGAFANNLKQVDVTFASHQIIAVTGISGSGKSSLIKEVLYESWKKNKAVKCKSVFGLDQFDEVFLIDKAALKQSGIGSPVTYTGIIEDLKTVFAKTEEAKSRGLKKADFSYLSKNGKCSICSGLGKQKTSMDFRSDIWLTCDTCQGSR